MRTPSVLASAAILAALVLFPTTARGDEPQANEEQPRLLMDKTGVKWAAPFGKALAAAKRDNRLLFIKPIAFGTGPNGCW